jgi:SAM-dependent methyltransferase
MTLSGRHIKGTMFHIGVRSGVYDVVWNAGVLEHFSEAEQIQALGEMARICKEDGLIITLHPYAGSMLYRSGKKILEKLGRWKYGRLAPIRSMRRVASANGLTLVREYPDDFFIQLVEGPRRFIPKLGPLFADALGYLVIRTRHPGLFSVQVAIDRFFAKRLGGYLIVSVMKKQSAA